MSSPISSAATIPLRKTSTRVQTVAEGTPETTTGPRLTRYPAWFRPLKRFLRTDVHRWLYDESPLAALHREAGFIDIRRRRYLESAIPGIEEVEREGRVVESICLEARKP